MGIQGRDVKQRYAVYDEASQMLWGETVAQPHGQIERLLVIHFFEGSTHAHQYTITAGQGLLLSDKLLEPFFTHPFNMSGQPAASIPVGFTDNGLPVGLQIVGRRFAEKTVLRASACFEAARPWADRWPAL